MKVNIASNVSHQTGIPNGNPFIIAGGEPVIVYAIRIGHIGTAGDIVVDVTDNDGTVLYSLRRGARGVFNVNTPFIASNGIRIADSASADTDNIDATVLHSQPGA